MNKKIIIALGSLLLIMSITISLFFFYAKQHDSSYIPDEDETYETEDPFLEPESTTTTQHRTDNRFSMSSPTIPRHSSAIYKKPFASTAAPEPTSRTKQEALNALPGYYGTPLTSDAIGKSKEQAQQNLPGYYGKAEAATNNKDHIAHELSHSYGRTAYPSIQHSIDHRYKAYSIEEEDEYEDDSTSRPEIRFQIDANNFFTGSHNQALLNEDQQYDKAVFFQTIINLPIDIKIPAKEWGKVEFNFTGRINTLWGSSELSQTTREFVKIGRAITETKHYHEFDRPLFWVQQTWLKLYSQSESTMFQIGFFPKQIGLGLILGNHYKAGNPLLTNTHEKFIDQYRPGLELSTTFGKRDYKATLYYSMYKNNATSFDKQVEFTQGQELCNCGDGPPFVRTNPSRPIFQTSHLITAQIDIPLTIEKTMTHDLHMSPFILYNKDRNQTVEFFGDAQSTLVTVGSTFNLNNEKFDINVDIAGNVGSQEVKGWDRNVTEEHARMTLTHLFGKSFDNIGSDLTLELEALFNASGDFVLSPTFPFPPGKDLSLEHAAGEEFQENNPNLIVPSLLNPGTTINLNTRFKNSYSRFRKCYQNSYRAFMAAADMGYKPSERYKLGLILGYSTGDENPNDTREKAYLYRLRDDWDQVRQDFDHTYHGFIGVQSLYTGKHVRTLQLLRSHRLNQPLSQVPELTANQFSNLTYGGVGFWHHKNYHSGTLQFNANVIAMGLSDPVRFGFDPVVQDIFETFNFKEDEATEQRFKSYDKTLSQYLGVEINCILEFFAKSNLTFYGMTSVFIPGSYYKDIKILSNGCVGKVIPLKNQYIGVAKDKSGFENAEKTCITLKNDIAIVAYAGIKFDFDTASLHNRFRKRKKNKVTL